MNYIPVCEDYANELIITEFLRADQVKAGIHMKAVFWLGFMFLIRIWS